MKKLICLPIALAAFCLIINFSAMGMSGGGWQLTWQQGHTAYFVNDGDKNQFKVVCGDEVIGAELHILVNGKGPQANSLVSIISDKINYTMRADGAGIIKTDCRECADNFARVLQGIKYSKKLSVAFSDGARVEFDTSGARDLLKGTVCITGYYH